MSRRKPHMNAKFGTGRGGKHRYTRRKAKQMLGEIAKVKVKPGSGGQP